MPLFETSAKDDDKAYHVEAIFVTLAHKIKKRNTKSSFVDSTKGKTRNLLRIHIKGAYMIIEKQPK